MSRKPAFECYLHYHCWPIGHILVKTFGESVLEETIGRHWPESSGLGNVADFWLATLPLALPPKIFLHFSLHYAILSQKVFGGNAIRVSISKLILMSKILKKHRRCLSYKVNLVLRKSQPSSETSI